MTVHETRHRIFTEEDFVAMKRFGYSLKKLMDRYPDGAPDSVIAQALAITEAEAEELYLLTVAKLRIIMGVEE